MEFRRVRNHIERIFGALDQHRFMWYSLFSHEVIAHAMQLIFNAECVRWQLEPPRATRVMLCTVILILRKLLRGSIARTAIVLFSRPTRILLVLRTQREPR